MAEPACTNHLSLPAAAMVAALPRRNLRRVLELADQVATHRLRSATFAPEDAAGYTVENLLIDGFLLTYWVDHSVKEVRIAEILPV